jgi:hypothetical protein
MITQKGGSNPEKHKVPGTAVSLILSKFGCVIFPLKLIFGYSTSPKLVLKVEFSHAELFKRKL